MITWQRFELLLLELVLGLARHRGLFDHSVQPYKADLGEAYYRDTEYKYL